LHGITEDTIFKIAKDLKIKTIRKKVTVKELKNSDELFFSGTAREVSPIISIDGRKIGNGKPGPITEKIKDNYFYIVRAKNKKYLKMLTFID
jgi:branched-chain amino acid aminotransferase